MARPPGDWDKAQSIQEFDLNASRATGWCLDITFERPDPSDKMQDVSFMLRGFSAPYFIKEKPDEIDHIYYAGRKSVARGGRQAPFKSVVGALPSSTAPLSQISKKIRVGMFLVLGDHWGNPVRIFKVPISFIVQSFVDLGG